MGGKKKQFPKGKELLKISELSKVTGIRYSTLQYYSEIGLIPYEQDGERMAKRYDKETVIRIFKEVQKLKEKGMSIEEIKKQIN
jgi:DNA-binding transcriptional MerR regulator